MNKNELRKYIKNIHINNEKKSIETENILKKCVELIIQLKPKSVYIYMDTQQEVPTKELIEYCLSHHICVGIPKVTNDLMEFHEIKNLQEVQLGAYQILEPIASCPLLSKADIAFIPGLAFDLYNHRLGHGKGYYDKFLTTYPYYIYKVGLCFSDYLFESIPIDSNDVLMNEVITYR